METMSLDAKAERRVDSAGGNASSVMRRTLASDNAPLVGIALAGFLAHMLVAGNYGYFRDELYYIAAGHHLAPGYVDFPALIALLAALLQPFGDNLVIIHIVPALANACLIFLTGLIAREFGGGRLAQFIAALTSAVCIAFMATGSIFSMDALDQLWWTLAAYVLVLLIKRQEPRLWLLFGLVAGIGLTTKLTMLFWGLAIVVGLLLTSKRRLLWSRWVLAGGALAVLFLLPYILWNIANGLPTWEFWHHYGGITGDGPLAYLGNQIFLINPFTVPVAILGLVFFFRWHRRQAVSSLRLGVCFPVCALYTHPDQILLSGPGLPTSVCRWGHPHRAGGGESPWAPLAGAVRSGSANPLGNPARPARDAGTPTGHLRPRLRVPDRPG